MAELESEKAVLGLEIAKLGLVIYSDNNKNIFGQGGGVRGANNVNNQQQRQQQQQQQQYFKSEWKDA